MASRNVLLRGILNRESTFCFLCLKSVEGDDEGALADIDDEVALQENYCKENIRISEIVSYVLGDEVYKDISAFSTACMQCVSNMVDTYRFIKDIKSNVQYLNNIVTTLDNYLGGFPTDIKTNSTLFITMNEDFNTNNIHCEGTDFIKNTSTASEFLNSLINGKIKTEEEEKPKNRKSNLDVKTPVKKDGFIQTIDMVHNQNLSSLVCKVCFNEFPTTNSLRNHYLRTHAPKTFDCSKCLIHFPNKALLNAHKTENHVASICSECGRTFNSICSLKHHEKSHTLKLVCQDCGRVYKNETTYKLHIANDICRSAVRHSPANAKFTCDHCGKKYTQKMTLRVHIQYEHLNYKYHECKWCDKKFWCQSRLKAHIVKHTKEKNFTCTICNGRFVTKESLLYHTRTHTGEKPYKCPHCDGKFLSASRRQAHIKSQHVNSMLECDVCHSKFKSLHYLMKHKKSHEEREPEMGTLVLEDAKLPVYVIKAGDNVFKLQESHGTEEQVCLEVALDDYEYKDSEKNSN